MNTFPILNENQVAVVSADGATGIVLNCSGETYRNDTKDNVYWLFEDIELARDFIKSKSVLNDKIEFLIYDKNQVIIEYIKATHWQ